MTRLAIALVLVGAIALSCSTISRSIRDRLPPPHEVEGGILFQYEAPAARMVNLAGNFNNWGGTQGGGRYDPSIDPMSDRDGDGIWTIVVPLPPGRYQYKFVIDGGVRWEQSYWKLSLTAMSTRARAPSGLPSNRTGPAVISRKR